MTAWYQRNKAAVIAKSSQQRDEMRAWFREYKKTLSCIQCGQNHPATLDFHHVVRRPDNRKIRDLVKNTTQKRILEELKKCVVLCSNCHRIHHHNERLDKHPDMPTIHIHTTPEESSMFEKIKAFFFSPATTPVEIKQPPNESVQQYASDERVEQKPAPKPAKPTPKPQAKPVPRKPVVPAKKPAAKPVTKATKTVAKATKRK